MWVLREVFACLRSYKALNALQNKPILASQPTPFLDGQIEGDSHSHEMQSAQGPKLWGQSLAQEQGFYNLMVELLPLDKVAWTQVTHRLNPHHASVFPESISLNLFHMYW